MQSDETQLPPHRFSADRPLERLSEDRLARKGFVERLASDIMGWHGKDSLVVSLNGEWGSGKTSLKNFLKERLRARGQPLVVEFNPWQWSGQDRVFEAFFSAIRAEFQVTDDDKETEKLAERWESFAAWTKLGAAVSSKLEQAITPLLGTSLAGALLANTAATPAVRWTGIGFGLAGILLTSFLAIFPEIAERLVEAAKVRMGRQKMSLAELRSAITEQLEKLRQEGRPVVVFVDDIDRLSQEEIRLLFQLVKANADFPNLVYVLLFPKDIVTAALSKVVAERGDDYLRKIVQVEFDVPLAPRARMLKIFQEDLNRVIDRAKPKMDWDKERIQHLFEDHLWPYFRTLRDVKRFIGTFDFYFNGQVNQGVLEVDPIDLLAIEILRTFDHEAYITVRDSLGYASEGDLVRALMGEEERTKQVDRQITALTSRSGMTPEEVERLGTILRNLFPSGKVGETAHERDLRICHPKHFHKYFEHALDDSPLSAANVQALMALVGQREPFAARLRELCQSGALEDVLEKLGVYFENIPAESAPGFVTALFDVGEEFPKERPGFFNQDTTYAAMRLIHFLLKKLPEQDARAKVLADALAATTGSVLPVLTIAFIEPRKEDPSSQVLLDEARLIPMRQAAVAKLEALAKSGAIWSSRHFPRLVTLWRRWAGDAPVQAWLQGELSTPERQLEFLVHFVGASTSGTEVVSYSLPAKTLEAVISLEVAAQAIKGLALTMPEQKAAGELLGRALQRKQAGQPYTHVEIDAGNRRRGGRE